MGKHSTGTTSSSGECAECPRQILREDTVGPVKETSAKAALEMTNPQHIFERLNGEIVGHYVMKKALSVSIYNHFYNSGDATRATLRCEQPEDYDLDGPPPPPRRRSYTGEMIGHKHYGSDGSGGSGGASDEIRRGSCDHPVTISPITEGTFLTPMVARVIIEASSHKVHLRKSNTLTFDPTGSGLPVGVIAKTIAAYLKVPYFRCDCRGLVPSPGWKKGRLYRRPLSRRSSLFDESQLLGTSIADAFSAGLLAPTASFRSWSPALESRIDQAIVFLDHMDSIGSTADNSEQDRKEIVRELMEIIDGTRLRLTRPRADDNALLTTGELVELNTKTMFFICFGVKDNSDMQTSSDESAATQADKTSRRTSTAASTISMETSSSSNAPSHSSGKGHHGLNKLTLNENRKTHSLWKAKKASSPSFSSGYEDDDDEFYDDDDDYLTEDEDLTTETRMAKMLLEGNNSPIPHYLDLWGLKDIDFRVSPEALEIMADQAKAQHAGANGVTTILEKLLFTVKFELPPQEAKRVKSIEISEGCVLGKEPPTFTYLSEGEERSSYPRRTPSYNGLSKAAVGVSKQLRKVSTKLTDFDAAVMEEIEL